MEIPRKPWAEERLMRFGCGSETSPSIQIVALPQLKHEIRLLSYDHPTTTWLSLLHPTRPVEDIFPSHTESTPSHPAFLGPMHILQDSSSWLAASNCTWIAGSRLSSPTSCVTLLPGSSRASRTVCLPSIKRERSTVVPHQHRVVIRVHLHRCVLLLSPSIIATTTAGYADGWYTMTSG